GPVESSPIFPSLGNCMPQSDRYPRAAKTPRRGKPNDNRTNEGHSRLCSRRRGKELYRGGGTYRSVEVSGGQKHRAARGSAWRTPAAANDTEHLADGRGRCISRALHPHPRRSRRGGNVDVESLASAAWPLALGVAGLVRPIARTANRESIHEQVARDLRKCVLQ